LLLSPIAPKFHRPEDDKLEAFLSRFREEQLLISLKKYGLDDFTFTLEVKRRSGELALINGPEDWSKYLPKLLEPHSRNRLYVHVKPIAVEGANAEEVRAKAAIAMMAAGTSFIKHPTPDTSRTSEADLDLSVAAKVLVFYVPCMFSPGSIFFCKACQPGEKVSHFSQRIPLEDLKAVASTAKQWTLTTSAGTYVLEASNAKELDAWNFGVSLALESRGYTMHKEASHASESRGSGDWNYTVKAPQMPGKGPPLQDIMADMAAGRTFAIFALGVDGTVKRRDIFMFYEDLFPTPFCSQGALYWCRPGSRQAASTHCIELENITDVFTGKRTDVFESAVAIESRAACCVSLVSREERMDLEAESPVVLYHWLRAIHKIKKKAGKKVIKDDVLPGDIAGPRRFDDLLPSEMLAQLAYFEDQTELEHLTEYNRLMSSLPIKDMDSLKAGMDDLRERLRRLERSHQQDLDAGTPGAVFSLLSAFYPLLSGVYCLMSTV
jgi:hypothetical protein